jgi:HSP20 family protein
MANITPYRPFEDMFGDLMKGFWLKPMSFPGEAAIKVKLDVNESDKAFTVKAEIPGVKKDDIHVDVDGNLVSISAEVKHEKEEKDAGKVVHSERYYGSVSRSFSLPVDVDPAGAKAEYKDGVLNLVLPKKAGGQSRRVSVQ